MLKSSCTAKLSGYKKESEKIEYISDMVHIKTVFYHELETDTHPLGYNKDSNKDKIVKQAFSAVFLKVLLIFSGQKFRY